jgi:small nuclear ribonucleoprotein (snRNP)-like protein
VLVSLVTGKAFKGKLIGADPYNLVLQQDSGLELMISKGNVIYLHATT